MTKTTVAMAFVLASILANSIPVGAQEPAAPIVGTWEGIKALPPKDELTIKQKDGGSKKGRLNTVTDTALMLSSGGKSIEVSREGIFQIYRSVPKSRKKATWIGAGVGAGLAMLSVGIGDSGSYDVSAGFIAAAVLLYAGIGALIGRGIASGHERVLIYEARR